MEHMPLHETKIHGIPSFPCSVYYGNIPERFVSFPLHWHDHFELIYCAAGQIQVTLWGTAYVLCAGDLIVILPHAVHSIEQSGDACGEYFNIMFHPSLFQGSESDPCYEKYVLPFLNGEKSMDFFQPKGSPFHQTVMPCIRFLIEHRKDSYSTKELLIKSNLFLLLYHINEYSTESDGSDRLSHLSYSRLKNALYYVQLFYDCDISVRKAAMKCGFSESHFMKLFKELTGMSFICYLVHYRLDLAAKQLKETDLKVIDIAENCGFHNHSYFTRVFRKKYGKAPLAYRKDAGR